MTDQTIASSVGQTQPHSVTFEVAEFILQDPERWLGGEWSHPVQFRFEESSPGKWDLVMRRVEDSAA